MKAMNEEIRGIIREYADDNELERFNAGFLPLEDADKIVRDVLFDNVADWPKAKPLHPVAVVELANLRHKDEEIPRNAHVDFETGEADKLGRDEFQRLKLLQTLFPNAKKIAPLCTTAKVGKLTHRRYKARVVLEVGDQIFSRDFWLDDERAPLTLDEMDSHE